MSVVLPFSETVLPATRTLPEAKIPSRSFSCRRRPIYLSSQSSVADAAGIEIVVQETARGIQAVEVIRIDPPAGEDQEHVVSTGGEITEPVDLSLPLEPARVKWFDKAKGFGFANVFGRDEDVFLHVEVLRRSGLADLQPGEAVSLRVVDGKRGRMATQVTSWEAALKPDA